MNRRDLEELRRRLEERQAAQVADPFALVVLAAAFFFLLLLIAVFV